MRNRRNLSRLLFILSILAWALFLVSLLATNVKAKNQDAAGTAAHEDGRLPRDDVPAASRCYLTEDEIEAAENEMIEAALLANSHKIENVTVTYYCICEKCCGKSPDHPAYGITAGGVMATPGVSVGVDPAVIPLGSDILLDYGDGELHYLRADDTGSGVSGNHIDLCVASHEEALQLGVRQATVYWVDSL